MASIWTSRQDLGIFASDLPKITAALATPLLGERTSLGRYTLLDLQNDPPFPVQGGHKKIYYCISCPLGSGQFFVHVAAQTKHGSSDFKREEEAYLRLRGVKGILQPLLIQQDEEFDYIISELFNRGDLFSFIEDPQRTVSGFESHLVAYQIVEAIHECHSRGIILRDLKPQNVLVRKLDNRYEINLIDFGCCFFVGEDTEEEATRSCYSPSYMAPEELDCVNKTSRCLPASFARDLWALGAILYALQLRQLPSRARYQDNKLVRMDFPIETSRFLGVFDSEIKDLLYLDSKERPSIEEIKKRMKAIFSHCYQHARSNVTVANRAKVISPAFPQTPLLSPKQPESSKSAKKCCIWSIFCCCTHKKKLELQEISL